MKLIEADIEKAAGLIIDKAGTDALTVHSLSRQMKMLQ